MENAQNPLAFYQVARLEAPFQPDGNWNKPQWQKVHELTLTHWMGAVPSFRPVVHAKMMYDDLALWLIFKVDDHYVRSVATEINGRVWEDSCVEFFFSPDLKKPLAYFNLEMNAGGVPLFHYKDPDNPAAGLPPVDDIKKIVRAGSLQNIIDPEIKEPFTWTMEYKIPLDIINRLSNAAKPAPGVRWHANFYKCGDKTSSPHWITWAKVDYPVPNFHLPQFFGLIEFA
jgi:hypothetical protein